MNKRIKQIIPFPLNDADLALRKRHVPDHVTAAGTEVVTVAVRNSFAMDAPRAATTYYEWALLESYVLEARANSEDEGYDAVVIDTTTDSALKALRSRLTIPVVGAGMTAYAVALVLAKRFSIVTYTDEHAFLVQDSLRAYGLQGMCSSVRAMGTQPVLEDAPHEAQADELHSFLDAAHLAVTRDGAYAIILASTLMHRVALAAADRLAVPIVDPGPVAIALADLLVRLNLSHSKVEFPSPGLIQDDLLRSLPSAPNIAESPERQH